MQGLASEEKEADTDGKIDLEVYGYGVIYTWKCMEREEWARRAMALSYMEEKELEAERKVVEEQKLKAERYRRFREVLKGAVEKEVAKWVRKEVAIYYVLEAVNIRVAGRAERQELHDNREGVMEAASF